jgi:sugar lactone lactonase YvrE
MAPKVSKVRVTPLLWGVIAIVIGFASQFLRTAAQTNQSPDTILTVAGSFPERTPALHVLLPGPPSVTSDRFGNTYVATFDGNTVLKVTHAGEVIPFAGNGIGGFSGDGGPATEATLDLPVGVATDDAGNVFIADLFNDRVRRVDHRTGIITTYAGNGLQGFSGDGGPATAASLNLFSGSNPFGSPVALDASGNLFISDLGNQRIRRVDAATGVINTVAGNGTPGFSGDGGAATSAELHSPSSVAVTPSGTYYINDSFNFVIRRVDGSTGIITTYAGQGGLGFCGDNGPAIDACLLFPDGLAVDDSGNLFIADTQNARIRRVDANTQVITTVAGNGILGFSGDGASAVASELNLPEGAAVDRAGNILIADAGNNRIREIRAANQIIRTIAGGGTGGDEGPALRATLAAPFGVAADTRGNIFFTDVASNRVRKVDILSGIITTVAGNGFANFSGDGGPATEASLNSPESQVAVDSAGNVFFDDLANFRIRRIDAKTGIITTVAGNGIPCFLAFMSCGDGGPAVDANILTIFGLTVDSAGNLFLSDGENSVVRRVDAATGIITTIAGNGNFGFGGDGGPAIDAELNSPFGVSIDSSGNLFIADAQNERIRRVDAVSGFITTVAGNGNLGDSGDGGPATNATFNFPASALVDRKGNLFIGDLANGVVRFVQASTGNINRIAGDGTLGFGGDGGPALGASLDFAEIGLDSFENVLIADSANNRIRRFRFTPCSANCEESEGSSVPRTNSLPSSLTSRLAAVTARLAPRIRLAQFCRVAPQQPACRSSIVATNETNPSRKTAP